MITINYSTLQGHESIPSQTMRFPDGESKEAQFRIAKGKAMETASRSWETETFSLVFNAGTSSDDVRHYSSAGNFLSI